MASSPGPISYQEAIQFLYDLQLFGTKPGLERSFKLAALAGDLQKKLRFIHVAGTNGKGSTCAMLESIYRAAGLKVGLFTSPHLVHFGERIQVNRELISDADIIRSVEKTRELLKGFSDDEHPTFFEAITVIALQYFAEQHCDLVIWETGLGGRLDATNIVSPLASVITNIQLDHQKWLGESLAQIASEKAGIIKFKTPVLTATTHPEALAVITEKAKEQLAPLTLITERDLSQPPLNTLALPLLGDHQKWNAALALAVVRSLNGQIPVSEPVLRAGLEKIVWAGRLQVIKPNPQQTILLDGAHNIGGMEVLRDALHKYFPGQKPALILGMLGDKDWKPMCKIIAPVAERIALVPVSSQRTAIPEELRMVCQNANPTASVSSHQSFEAAFQMLNAAPFIVIAGSIYLIGEAMEKLHLAPMKPTDERGLNEWSQTTLSPHSNV